MLELALLVGSEALAGLASPHRMIREGSGISSPRAWSRAMRVAESEGWAARREFGNGNGDWVYDLTDRGVDRLLDGILPDRAWAESWDGLWRSVSFDLPASSRGARHQLDRWLAKRRFGHLQGSLWITPRSYRSWSVELEERKVDPRRVIFWEGKPLGGLHSSDYVAKAWDFGRINERYAAYLEFLNTSEEDRKARFEDWHAKESVLWTAAFSADPFLPAELLPVGYLGREAWRRRKETFVDALSAV